VVRLGSQGLVVQGSGTGVAALGAVRISSSSLGGFFRAFRVEHTAAGECGQAGPRPNHRAIVGGNRNAPENVPGREISRVIHGAVSRSVAPSGRT
jgi:hypothetical protein